MAKFNSGKIFESNFKASIPNGAYYYRFRDTATSYYGGNANLRFSNTNIADNLVYCNGKLYINELKSHKGKSLPISCIRKNQIEQLSNASQFNGVYPCLIVFFSDLERCFKISILDYLYYRDTYPQKKSIPLAFFEEIGHEIDVTKLRTNYRYNLNYML